MSTGIDVYFAAELENSENALLWVEGRNGRRVKKK
jgi:hypothetical protein